MVVNSFNIEFGYELISILPYANYLNSIGKLTGTISAVDTEPFYFFSPKHTISEKQRGWDNMKEAWAAKIPNIGIHTPKLDKSQWLPPNYKRKYQNNVFLYAKEPIVICNRINVEWGKAVINFFDIEILKQLFKLLENYTVLYFNIDGFNQFYDGVQPVGIGDYELCRQYSNVYHIKDLYTKYKHLTGGSFNLLQLMLMANCSKFVSMNGGYGILSSYFGGENIIYSKECRELSCGSFNNWYKDFSGAKITVTQTYNDLIERVKQWQR